MANAWNYDRAVEHINSKIEDVRTVDIKEYKREMSLENIPTNTAYRVDGVHLYADITNLEEICQTACKTFQIRGGNSVQ